MFFEFSAPQFAHAWLQRFVKRGHITEINEIKYEFHKSGIEHEED